MRKPRDQARVQNRRVLPCINSNRFGKSQALGNSRHAPPADRSTMWQSIGVVFGPSKMRPTRGTKPLGDTRNHRRLFDPSMRKLYDNPRNFISPVDYRSLTGRAIDISLKLRDIPEQSSIEHSSRLGLRPSVLKDKILRRVPLSAKILRCDHFGPGPPALSPNTRDLVRLLPCTRFDRNG
jgi:hypothetical protein